MDEKKLSLFSFSRKQVDIPPETEKHRLLRVLMGLIDLFVLRFSFLLQL